MGAYHTVAKVGEIPAGEGRSFPVDGTMVAVFNIDGEYMAINDTCPHMGASLAAGYVEGTAVTCPWHAWRFCVKDGRWLDNPRSKIANACYAVRVEGDKIQVALPDVPQPRLNSPQIPSQEPPRAERDYSSRNDEKKPGD